MENWFKKSWLYILIVLVVVILFLFKSSLMSFVIYDDLSSYTKINFPCGEDVSVLDEQGNEYEVQCDEELTFVKIPSEKNRVYYLYYDEYRKGVMESVRNKNENVTFIIENENLVKYR